MRRANTDRREHSSDDYMAALSHWDRGEVEEYAAFVRHNVRRVDQGGALCSFCRYDGRYGVDVDTGAEARAFLRAANVALRGTRARMARAAC